MNVAVARFNAQYKKDDSEIVHPFLIISLMLTCHCVAPPEQMQMLGVMFQKVQTGAPLFSGLPNLKIPSGAC